jgi:putative cardiolipin synthase
MQLCVRPWPAAERLFSSALIGLLLVLLVTTGCAGLPPRDTADAPDSFAIARPAQARLANTADKALAQEAHASAFRLLPIGSAAYQTLIELASQAEHSLDFQTFVLYGDTSGALLLKALRDAAARGVRVRALIDDLHTDSAEQLLSDMAACAAIEVRLINPFMRLRGSRAAKLVSSLDQLNRVNHRMHNKLFVADNVLAVIGGRNVGDPYFMRAEEGENFIDLDVLAAGAAVDQMSESFDAYWNSEFAWPIDRIVAPAGSRLERCARFDLAVSRFRSPPPDLGVPLHLTRYATVADELRRGALDLIGADAEVVADPVDKLAGTRVGSRRGTVRAFIGGEGLGSSSDILAFSPYYVPGSIGIESIRQNRRNGVRVRVLTNSLASSDEPVVHAGYLEYRREMLEIGVELYELSPKFAKLEQRLGRFGTSSPALHMKAIVFDQKSVFIGSMNLDGRSEQYNTEVGVMIRSHNLTRELTALVNFESSSYRVELDPGAQLRWVNLRRGQETVHDAEPEVGFWRNVTSKVLGLLIPRDWL